MKTISLKPMHLMCMTSIPIQSFSIYSVSVGTKNLHLKSPVMLHSLVDRNQHAAFTFHSNTGTYLQIKWSNISEDCDLNFQWREKLSLLKNPRILRDKTITVSSLRTEGQTLAIYLRTGCLLQNSICKSFIFFHFIPEVSKQWVWF